MLGSQEWLNSCVIPKLRQIAPPRQVTLGGETALVRARSRALGHSPGGERELVAAAPDHPEHVRLVPVEQCLELGCGHL